MPHCTSLNFSRYETYECGAMLVSLLAYPQREAGVTQRENLRRSLCAIALRAQFGEETDAWTKPRLMKPVYALRDARQIERDEKPLKRLLHQRMIAARMAIGFLQEVELKRTPKLPKGIKRLSVNQMAGLALEDGRESDATNVKKRIWKPSLPVIHLAAATAVIKDMADKAGFGPLSIGHLITNRIVIERIVQEAQRYEPMLFESKLKIRPETLEKVRLA